MLFLKATATKEIDGMIQPVGFTEVSNDNIWLYRKMRSLSKSCNNAEFTLHDDVSGITYQITEISRTTS